MNTYYLELSHAYSNERRQRIKGYYICPTCGEFIKTIARKVVSCPFCGRDTERMLVIDSLKEQMILAVWKDAGCFSELRADYKKEVQHG